MMSSLAKSATETRAERTEVGPEALSRLPDADYADAFRIASAPNTTAEQWARRAFESGPRAPRQLFGLIVWQGVLGFRLVARDSPNVAGRWAIVENEPEILVLRSEGRLMAHRMIVEASGSHTTLTTLLRYERPAARRVWSAVGNAHRALAPRILERARRSLTHSPTIDSA